MLKVQILGRLGRNAQVYKSANGSEFIGFTLAVNTRNQGSDVTYWIDVRSFNSNHIKLEKYLTKGKIIQVGGDLNTGTMTDKLGVVRINHNVLADYITFVNLGSGGNKTSEKNAEGSETDSSNEKGDTKVDTDNKIHTVESDVIDESTINMNNSTTTPLPQDKENVMVGATVNNDPDELPF